LLGGWHGVSGREACVAARFDLRRGADGQFAFTFIGPDGEPLLTGQPQAMKASATAAIASVRKHAADSRNYFRQKDASGKPCFVLASADNEVLGTSPGYFSDFARDVAIDACRAAAPTAETVEAAV
jgi:uncharacterized protein YegP (UPF0339 family)